MAQNQEAPAIVRPTVLAVRGVLYQVSMGGVLILRRSDSAEHSPGHWELPGGKFGDTCMSLDQAIEREFAEETKIPIYATQPPIYVWDKPAGLPPKYPGNVHYICIVLRVHLIYPDVREVVFSSEHDDFKWIVPAPDHLTPFGDYLPKETRNALELFYRDYILNPQVLRYKLSSN